MEMRIWDELKNHKTLEFIDELPGGEMNHIVTRDKKEPVGYVEPATTLEIYKNPAKDFRKEHEEIERIYREVMWEYITLLVKGVN